jgi:hypothetical protein
MAVRDLAFAEPQRRRVSTTAEARLPVRHPAQARATGYEVIQRIHDVREVSALDQYAAMNVCAMSA